EPTHISKYHRVRNERSIDHVDIDKAKTFLSGGLTNSAETEAERYEALIKEKGPMDLRVLDLGLNGHTGFNELGTHFEARTHVAKLVESTREVNARFFDHIDEVPIDAISMGIETILDAKKIILLVYGEAKADILRQVIHGEITEDVPASILQKHPNVTVITDIDV